MPKVVPNSSLKNGPTTLCGRVKRMSPIFLRIWYQSSGTSFERRSSRATKITWDSPGREKDWMRS
ncbi:hypothetical protein D3C78_1621530 [compost metagenome]